jgi:hypothetical protein
VEGTGQEVKSFEGAMLCFLFMMQGGAGQEYAKTMGVLRYPEDHENDC